MFLLILKVFKFFQSQEQNLFPFRWKQSKNYRWEMKEPVKIVFPRRESNPGLTGESRKS